MLTNDYLLYGLSVVLALIPIGLWLNFVSKQRSDRKTQLLLFIGSIFSVVPIFALQHFFELYPNLDPVQILNSAIKNDGLQLVTSFIWVGITEELVKQFLVRWVDKKHLLIQTINDSLHYSLIGALGFAFAENIFYIYGIYTSYGIQQLFVAYTFRSIFTICAHMIFAGFFGYYYGLAKFSINIIEERKASGGKKLLLINKLSSWLNIPRAEVFREMTILKGLFIAIFLHASFDILLQLNQIIPVAIFVIIFGALLIRLIKRKAGNLILITDPENHKVSTMNKKDEDVVIELVSMWLDQKRYVDVMHICQRLLQRDPDNKIVQMFKDKATDGLDESNIYGKILKNMYPGNQKSIEDLSKEKLKFSPTQNKNHQPEKPKEENQYFNLKI